MPADVCRKVVSKTSNLSCHTIVSENCRKYTDCFICCRNSVAAENCRLLCDQEFRKDMHPDIRSQIRE